jgi:hypothetical protein
MFTDEDDPRLFDPPTGPDPFALPKGLCCNCNKRPVQTWWVAEGGALAFAHGAGRPWCMICVLEAQIAAAEKEAARLPALRAELEMLQKAEADSG